ncbi:MAG: tRNA lysidine(34) synthetase TilS [Myxococcales bacterium]|nr:tRNA lysidine(34) synthetase TilS [Myxococcales bacterium]
MKQAVVRAIRGLKLWEAGQTVAIAVSGGRDSLVLADVLLATRGLHGGRLSIAHVDHGLHPDAPRWAAHVEAFAAERGVPCAVHRVTCGPSEDAARRARFAVLDGLPVDRVALGHHARDQAETVLVNLLRGTGPRGLGGMAPRRGRYVRPLLGLQPADLTAWAEERRLVWVEDPTNARPTYLRNRVRHELLPVLEGLREGSVTSLARSAALAAEDEALLGDLAAELPLDPRVLAGAPRPLARRRLRDLAPGATVAQIEALLAAVQAGRGRVSIGGDVTIVVQTGEVVVEGDSGVHGG